MQKLILLGSGGQAKSCIEVIHSKNFFKVDGLICKSNSADLFNIKILGDDDFLNIIQHKNKINLHIAIGFIRSPKLKINLFKKYKGMGFKFPVLLAESAIISKRAKILEGTIVHHMAFINYGARIGYNSIINTSSIIEHDTQVGNNCHISTGVILNGDVIVGDNTFIGSGAKVSEGVKIGKNCFIAIGKIVTKNLKDNTVLK